MKDLKNKLISIASELDELGEIDLANEVDDILKELSEKEPLDSEKDEKIELAMNILNGQVSDKLKSIDREKQRYKKESLRYHNILRNENEDEYETPSRLGSPPVDESENHEMYLFNLKQELDVFDREMDALRKARDEKNFLELKDVVDDDILYFLIQNS